MTTFTHGGSVGKIEKQKDRTIVTGIETKNSERGKGHAHEVMKKITSHLDKHKTTAELHAVAHDEDGDGNKLVKFYEKHGFKKTGKPWNHMIRHPSINEDVPTNSTSVNVAGTTNDVTWKKVKSALWNRKKKMKTFKEFVEITEAAKYENYDENSSAHNILKALNKDFNPRKKLATYHKDGSATFHAYSKDNAYHSYNIVDGVLKHAGGEFNHHSTVYDDHKQTIKGHEYHSKKVSHGQHDIHVKKV